MVFIFIILSLSYHVIPNNHKLYDLYVGTSAINVISTSSGTVTSVITTGPDGTSLDEGSQQSTLSNASAG